LKYVLQVLRRVKFEIKNYRFRLFSPIYPEVLPLYEVEKLGSLYGQKFLAPNLVGNSPILISGGVGEDISFDIEFLNKYGGEVFFFDPTDRAIKYIENLRQYLGNEKSIGYTVNGVQPYESYNLLNISTEVLNFYPLALLDSAKRVKFYQPRDASHVSYSVQNIQNSFSEIGNFIEVDAIGPIELCHIVNSKKIDILKLDIEGSEYYFLSSLFANDIFPIQILVEIDELSFPSIKSRKMANLIFRLMQENSYLLIKRSGFEFTYAREIK